MNETIETIRRLNDRLRCEHEGGRIQITQVIVAKGSRFLTNLDDALRHMTIAADDDPYHEHDFGAVAIRGAVIMFKIDYYDLDARHASPDPSDENVTLRVMTIMLEEEY